MKITLLGESGCHEKPHGRFAANMIECAGGVYFVDGGCSLADEILRRGVDRTRLRAIFTTSVRGECTAGILPLVDLINWAWKDCSVQVFYTTRELLCATENMISCVEILGERDIDRARLDFKLAAPGIVYEDENITARYIAVGGSEGNVLTSYSVLITDKATGEQAAFNKHE